MGSRHILVTSGAGYIGSHMTKMVSRRGYAVTVLDDLSKGYAWALRYGETVIGSTGDAELLETLFRSRRFDAVMHFAGSIEVAESVGHPMAYYENNVVNTKVLLDSMVRNKVPSLVFSSTAAIFGNPEYSPINESHPKNPINPYGKSKLITEQMIDDFRAAYRLRAVSLRYFNAAVADSEGGLGEAHNPETHLIPLVLRVASGKRESISVFGSEFNTLDGTCIRDYVHIQDLCEAHILPLDRLLNGNVGGCYNLGNGTGFSVLEVIGEAENVTKTNIPIIMDDARPGDPGVLVADSARATCELG